MTASAAGLFTMLGSAPYSVTKHAAEGYAEWLARDLRAPRPGRALHLPAGRADEHARHLGQAGQVVLKDAVIEPEQVAEALLAGMETNRFLILPHPEVRGYYQLRAE